MSLLAKTLVVLNLILAVFFLGVSATVFTTSKNWVKESNDFQAAYQERIKDFEGLLSSARDVRKQLEADKIANQGEISRLDKAKVDLENSVGELTKDKAKLQSSLDQANESNAQKDRYLESRDSDISQLTARLNEAQEALNSAEEVKKESEKRLARALLDKAEIAKQAEEASIAAAGYKESAEENQNLLARLIEKGVKIDDLIVKPVAPAIDGQVVAVSEVDKLIVMSVGSHDKVDLGQEFSISRGSSFIGKAKVNRVTDDMAAAQILWLVDGKSPQVGDRVRTGTAQ